MSAQRVNSIASFSPPISLSQIVRFSPGAPHKPVILHNGQDLVQRILTPLLQSMQIGADHANKLPLSTNSFQSSYHDQTRLPLPRLTQTSRKRLLRNTGSQRRYPSRPILSVHISQDESTKSHNFDDLLRDSPVDEC